MLFKLALMCSKLDPHEYPSEVRSESSRTSTAGGMITDSRGKRKKRGRQLAVLVLTFEIAPRAALHAKSLAFTQPATKERLQFETDLPEDMQTVIEKWRVYVSSRPE